MSPIAENSYVIDHLLGHNAKLNKFQILKSYRLCSLNTEKVSRKPTHKEKQKIPNVWRLGKNQVEIISKL